MHLDSLTDNFAIPDVLAFNEGQGGLPRAVISTSACTAEIYFHGAHLTAWQPMGNDPVIFLSERSPFAEDKAIRGGVPIIFPWFGNRSATPASPRTDGPAHGFARISPWNLAFAAMAGDNLHLAFTLGPDDLSRELGYDRFQLAFELTLGRELRMKLTVMNQGVEALHFEEALHTYFAVSDASQITINGLAGTEFLDKTDNFQRKTQTDSVLRLTAATDRPYLNTTATVSLDDAALKRRIVIAKSNSQTTVIWNPWAESSAKMTDMTPDNWRHLTCIETANAADNTITLAPAQAHSMEAHITVEALG